MKKHLEYKGYLGSVEFSLDDNLLFGKLLFINDLISYSAETVAELNDAFKHAVNDYLETCAELGDQPDLPFKGSLGIRLTPELHRECALSAIKEDLSINEWIKTACQEKLKNLTKPISTAINSDKPTKGIKPALTLLSFDLSATREFSMDEAYTRH